FAAQFSGILSNAAVRRSKPRPRTCLHSYQKNHTCDGRPYGRGERAPAQKAEKDQDMASILVNSEKDVEIAAQDALKWLSSASKALTVAPSVVAALGTLFGQLETPIAAVAGVAASPLNIALDV